VRVAELALVRLSFDRERNRLDRLRGTVVNVASQDYLGELRHVVSLIAPMKTAS